MLLGDLKLSTATLIIAQKHHRCLRHKKLIRAHAQRHSRQRVKQEVHSIRGGARVCSMRVVELMWRPERRVDKRTPPPVDQRGMRSRQRVSTPEGASSASSENVRWSRQSPSMSR